MEKSLAGSLKEELKSLMEFKKTERHWHIPVLAAFCVGVPLLIGYFSNHVQDGILASMSGLVILYIPFTPIANRMATLMICSFGFIISFLVGLFFSFNPFVASVVLGVYSFGIYWLTKYFRIKPPGYFFFILIIGIAICMPFNPETIPHKIGIITMGTISTCMLAFLYSLMTLKRYSPAPEVIVVNKNQYANLIEASIIGGFIGLSLLIAHLFKMENPYWVPTSCAAVMQGVSSRHIWQRSIHRIFGTFVGIGLAWFLLHLNMSALAICISIFVLQFIVEMLVTRNYGLAVIFITALTIFLAEGAHNIGTKPEIPIYTRFLDILMGSSIGAIGGWFLYHQKLHRNMHKHLRKTRIQFIKKSKKNKI